MFMSPADCNLHSAPTHCKTNEVINGPYILLHSACNYFQSFLSIEHVIRSPVVLLVIHSPKMIQIINSNYFFTNIISLAYNYCYPQPRFVY